MLRRTPLKAKVESTRSWVDRSKRQALGRKGRAPGSTLAARSPRKQALLGAEHAFREAVRDRDGRRCTFPHGSLPWLRCSMRLEVHHVASRGARPDLALDPDNGTTLCSLSHAWVTDHPAEAMRLGLYARSYDVVVKGRVIGLGR